MVDIDLTVSGGDQLYSSMSQFPIELQVKELQDALKNGAGQVLADEMEATAPRSQDIGPRPKADQHTADNIVVAVEKHPIGSAAEVYVGPSSAISWRVRFIELGTTVHAIVIKRKKALASATDVFGKKVNHPGNKPNPFMRRALDSKGQAAIDAFRQMLADGIARVAKKLNKSSQ
jgi:HK97 gp10 family phage protein